MSIENSNEKINSSNDEEIKPILELNDQLIGIGSEKLDFLYASRFKRWLASLINTLLFYIAIFIGAIILADIGAMISTFLYIGYQVYLMHNSKQTLGKKLLKLQVINYTTKEPLELGRYILREFVENVFAFTGILALISVITAFVSDDKRSLVDLMMKTIVVKKV